MMVVTSRPKIMQKRQLICSCSVQSLFVQIFLLNSIPSDSLPHDDNSSLAIGHRHWIRVLSSTPLLNIICYHWTPTPETCLFSFPLTLFRSGRMNDWITSRISIHQISSSFAVKMTITIFYPNTEVNEDHFSFAISPVSFKLLLCCCCFTG